MSEELQTKLNNALKGQDYSTALTHCEALLNAGSSQPYILAIKGWCLYKSGQLKDAEPLLVEAFNQDPSQHFVATMVMSFYMEQGDYQQVVALGQLCVGLHANDRLMWHRLGTAHFMQADCVGAVAAFRRSLAVEYSKLTAFALSQPLLCQGQYEEGLELYEHRFDAYPKLNWLQCEKMPMPQWQGEPLAGKSLLVWSEQGLGDSIQFSRMITVLAQQGATVDLMLSKDHSGLAELLNTVAGVSEVNVIHNQQVTLTRRYDYHSPLMSLMKGIQLTPSTIPELTFPYISLPTLPKGVKACDRNPELYERLPTTESTKIKAGIVWTTALPERLQQQDNLHFMLKERKSLGTADILPVLQLEGFQFFCLHVVKSPAVEQVLGNHDVVDMSMHIKDFADTATIIEAMDLIISVDTSVAHLAGALNKPVMNLLPFAADWRWQNNREDTPWYPSMRLLRQTFFDDWSTVSERLQQYLPEIRQRYQATGEIQVFL